MRHILLSLLLAATSYSYAQITETATDAVKNMGLGWNLGNTLDANYSNQKPTDDTYWGGQDITSETWWGQPVTKPALMKMMKEAGFGAIRVPVTWFNHMDKNGKVNEAWMKRVHEVVDYVIDNDMYCIINVHHDTGADDSNGHVSWLKADATYYNNYKEKYEYLWKQIAEEFKDYDKHLLFESFNEMLDGKNSWCFASYNTSSRYDATISTNGYKAINDYAQLFVNTVRATGSNNASRNLIVNTYAAACGEGNYMWNTHLNEPLTNMNIPTDKVNNHIIFEVHCYPSLTNNGSAKSISTINNETDNTIKNLKEKLVSKGAPVIFGEWGPNSGNEDYNNRHDLMLQFIDHFVKETKANGIGTFYWMGLSDGVYRDRLQFNQADVAETMAKAYHGSSFNGKFPDASKSSYIVCFEGEKSINWGNGISIHADDFKGIGEKAVLEITYTQLAGSPDFQFFYGDWSKAISFAVDGKTYTSDFNPANHYKTSAGSEHKSVFTFDADTYKNLAVKGLVVHGTSATIKKAVLYDPSVVTAGISNVSLERNADNSIYTISGQKVNRVTKGLYIRNGKKFNQK